MVLIKNLIDYHDEGDFERDRIWAIYTGPVRINYVNHKNIFWEGGVWNIDFQYTLKIIFTDGTEMVFTGGPEATEKKNESGVDLLTFLKNYIENGYEFHFDQDYIELDDLIL